MGWQVAAEIVMVVHLAFVLFVVVGGFLTWRWPKIAFAQVPAAVYGVIIELAGFRCPLTPLENSLRRNAGSSGYEGGFVEHYLVDLLYPGEFTTGVKVALAVGVVVANAVAYGVVWRRRAS